jgi:hypothetical protein
MIANNGIKIITSVSIICFNLMAAQVHSQIALQHSSSYDKNIYRTNSATSDWVHQTLLTAATSFHVSSFLWDVSYLGQIVWFSYNSERTFANHQFNSGLQFKISQHIQTEITGDVSREFNRDRYTIYDFWSWHIQPTTQFLHWQSNPVEAGYRFRSRHYPDIAELTYREHHAFFEAKHFFPTRTTIILNIGWYQKTYQTGIDTTYTIQRKIPPTKGYPGHSGGGRSNNGSPDPEAPAHEDTVVTLHPVDGRSTQRVELMVRVAQSLTQTTGISLDWTNFNALDDNARYLTGQQYNYTVDDELYNDPYNYNGMAWQSTITQHLPCAIQMKLYVCRTERHYRYAVINSSNNFRDDREMEYGLELTRRLTSWPTDYVTSFSFSTNYLDNESNNPYYNFSAPSLLFGIRVIRN